MKIIMKGNDPINRDSGIMLDGHKVGVSNWELILSKQEVDIATETTQRLWESLYNMSGIQHFKGAIRPDYVPHFKDNAVIKENIIHLGELGITGSYEVNTNSIECMAALSYMQFTRGSENPPRSIIRLCQKIKETFGRSEKIIFVAGTENAKVKRDWAQFLIRYLKKELNLEVLSPEELMRLNPEGRVIWRWGDVRKGECQFSDEFNAWLFDADTKNTIFNTLPENGKDVSDKSFLVTGKGSRALLFHDDIEWAKTNKNSLVLKPGRGTSGNGVKHGGFTSQDDWDRELSEKLQEGGYILQEDMPLPKISVPEVCDIVIDFNPIFWADNKKLTYLYTIIRLDLFKSYVDRGRVINVAQGGSFAEVFEE